MRDFQLTLHVPVEREASVRKAMADARAAPTARLKSAWSRGGRHVFELDVRRVTRHVQSPTGTVEVHWDRGAMRSGRHRAPVSELVIVPHDGSPFAVIECAYRWLARHGLWLELRDRAARGEALAAGSARLPPRAAQPVVLKRRMPAAEAMQAVLRECAGHVLVNAGQVASGDFEPEHIHQLRVGLRRLRVATRLFRGLAPDPGLAAPAAAWFKALGPARDRDVLATEVGAALQRDGQACGLLPAPSPGHAAHAGLASPALDARAMAAQDLGLQLLANACLPLQPEGDAGPRLAPALRRRLDRWHDAAVAQAAEAPKLDDAARHDLRKRLKRLRYGLEFASSLFEPRPVARYLSGLKSALQAMGEVNDLALARDTARGLDTSQRVPADWFALGWLSARHDALRAAADAELAAFARQDGPCVLR